MKNTTPPIPPASARHAAPFTRRRFLRTTALAALAGAAFPYDRLRAAADTPAAGAARFKNLVTSGRKIRIAGIGVGARGSSHLAPSATEELVALCDVDFDRARRSFALYPQLPRYRDYRRMLDEMGDRIDAVVISTPDHMHFPPALMAIERGKHLYVEKPMTHTIGEARLLKAAAARHGVVTQMGNQGAAAEGCRITREWIEAGVIGTVREVHSWTNRPVWPQGVEFPAPDPRDKKNADPVPATLDWNLWLGVAPVRQYAKGIMPFNWRGFVDYGCGALGDMGCHILNAPFFALDLRGDCAVSAESSGMSAVAWPAWSVITYQFPQRGKRAPLKLVWYDGDEKKGARRPALPEALGADVKLSKGGNLYIGDQGVLMDTNDYGGVPQIYPEARRKEFLANRPDKTLPRAFKNNIHQDWFRACKGEGPAPCSNFVDHAADLAEVVLLGNLALQAGKPIRWDAAAGACAGAPELDRYIHKNYRLF
jgi:predicted dehydrogenase